MWAERRALIDADADTESTAFETLSQVSVGVDRISDETTTTCLYVSELHVTCSVRAKASLLIRST